MSELFMNKEVKPLKVSIFTLGCQMNQYDTEVAQGFLKNAGYEIVEEIGDSPKNRGQSLDADVVIMNTCSVREHAEDKVYSRLGKLGKFKKQNPGLIIGLMGCMVEEHKEKLFKRFPQLDFMVGTRNIKELPVLIDQVTKTRPQISKIKQDGISIEYTDLVQRKGTHHAWLPIMTGCDKVCTYCIVPITRGAEVSMPAREVYREASRLVSEGVKCITLLGQNVNSYSSEGMSKSPRAVPDALAAGAGGTKVSFPELLDMLCQIDGLELISFTTSHPHDATDELFRMIAKNPKISRRFHLPLQSGSDRILKRMKRLHTFADYKAKIDSMRALIPDVAVTTDIIAGFSGETEEDHEATIRVLCQIRYDGAYIYKYSVRPATPAAKLPDDVPFETKEARNQELLDLQKRISREINRESLGREVSVFVEGVSTKNGDNPRKQGQSPFLIGRTNQDKKVVFEGDQSSIGQFQKVTLAELKHETFIGKPISS